MKGQIDGIKAFLKSYFKITELGATTNLLGVKVNYDREAGTLSLSQTDTIDALIREFRFEKMKPSPVPAVKPRLTKTAPIN